MTCNALSINDIEVTDLSINIYPNPTKENITINTPHYSGKVETQVFDLLYMELLET